LNKTTDPDKCRLIACPRVPNRPTRLHPDWTTLTRTKGTHSRRSRVAKAGQDAGEVTRAKYLAFLGSGQYQHDSCSSWRSSSRISSRLSLVPGRTSAVRLASIQQISVPSGSGEAGADEQFVAVCGVSYSEPIGKKRPLEEPAGRPLENFMFKTRLLQLFAP
jgi:hypothetical protein